jgi:hypothetical protein
MSLFALNSMDAGVRGIHSPRQITVKQVTPAYDPHRPQRRSKLNESVVAVIEEGYDGKLTIRVKQTGVAVVLDA